MDYFNFTNSEREKEGKLKLDNNRFFDFNPIDYNAIRYLDNKFTQVNIDSSKQILCYVSGKQAVIGLPTWDYTRKSWNLEVAVKIVFDGDLVIKIIRGHGSLKYLELITSAIKELRFIS